jgi:hypothetical protein
MLPDEGRDISGHRKLLLALLATRNSSGCLIGKRKREENLVRQKKTQPIIQWSKGCQRVSAHGSRIYREWIAKEIERKLVKDAEIAKVQISA